MATISHKNLTGSQIHEPKGADSATANKLYVSDGAGSGSWQKLTHNQLQTTGNPFGAQLLHVQDQKTLGTSGGSGTNSVWTTRTLNTSITNEISGASLASNLITLPAGTYFLDAYSTVGLCQQMRLRWWNNTDSSLVFESLSCFATSAANNCYPVYIGGRFTIAATKDFALQVNTFGAAANVLGIASSLGTQEIYSDVKVWKIA